MYQLKNDLSYLFYLSIKFKCIKNRLFLLWGGGCQVNVISIRFLTEAIDLEGFQLDDEYEILYAVEQQPN